MTTTEAREFSIPTMEDIRALPKNGYRVASTFAGGGGSSTGYRMAGFSVVYANEFVEAARETYALNADPSTVLDGRDIRTVEGEDLLEKIGLDVGELDLLDGSPPCSAFSIAGRRHEKWGKSSKYSDTEQQVDDLFFEFSRLVGQVRPKVFVAENVAGLVRGLGKGYFKMIMKALEANGYRVAARLLDASWLGVPQMRNRVIFVGVRNDLGVDPAHPSPNPVRTSMREALPTLGDTSSPAVGFFVEGRPPVDGASREVRRYSYAGPAATVTTIGFAGVGSGQTMFATLRDTVGETDPETGVPLTLGRHFKGVQNITSAYPHLLNSPYRIRNPSLGELRTICGYPADFQLTGNYTRRWERLGRSVPPLMMKAVAQTVAEEVLSRCAD